MKIWLLIWIFAAMTLCGCSDAATSSIPQDSTANVPAGDVLKLPDPRTKGQVSLEEALANRRSNREFSSSPLKLEDVSQLLWSAQGITSAGGGRTAPSAGALYPLEIYLVAGNVQSLSAGIYRYQPQGQALVRIKDGDVRNELARAAVGQACVKQGAISLVIAGVYERTTAKYGDRGTEYVHLEAGHAAQDVCLQATALNLNVVTVGAFTDDHVKSTVGLSKNESPLYIIPIGRKP